MSVKTKARPIAALTPSCKEVIHGAPGNARAFKSILLQQALQKRERTCLFWGNGGAADQLCGEINRIDGRNGDDPLA